MSFRRLFLTSYNDTSGVSDVPMLTAIVAAQARQQSTWAKEHVRDS